MWSVIHWAARLIAAVALLVILLFVVGELFSGPRSAAVGAGELCLGACFVLMAAGLIVGFRHERLGGGLTLGSLALFYAVDFLFSGSWPRGAAFIVLFGTPALLFLLSGDHDTKHEMPGLNAHAHPRA